MPEADFEARPPRVRGSLVSGQMTEVHRFTCLLYVERDGDFPVIPINLVDVHPQGPRGSVLVHIRDFHPAAVAIAVAGRVPSEVGFRSVRFVALHPFLAFSAVPAVLFWHEAAEPRL